MSTLGQDLRYGIRMLVKTPGFSVIAIIALALGIGTNTAIFSVVNAVLLRSLPYENPDRLVTIIENKIPQFSSFSMSPGNFLSYQKQSTSFDKLVALNYTAYNFVAGDSEPERLRAVRVSAGIFEMLGTKPVVGRTFSDDEDRPGHENVALISESLWKKKFGGDPNVIGQPITLNASTFTLIGVVPSKFAYPDDMDIWTPIAFTPSQENQHGSHYLWAIGRLKQGVSVKDAGGELKGIAARLAEEFPNSNAGWSNDVFSLQEYEVRDIKPGLVFVLGAVALVLLIACANVANLLLARATARQKEMAIRSALGASRWRIIRQLLTESVVLAALGGIIGLVLAYWGTRSLTAIAPADMPRIKDTVIDGRVLGFTILVTLVTGILFGLVPALQSSTPRLSETLNEGGRGTTGKHHRVRGSLVVGEVALSLVLLVCAGLLIRSFVNLQHVNPGFNPKNGLAVNISLPGKKYPKEEMYSAFYTQLVEKTSALPSVVSAGLTQSMPLQIDFLVSFNIQGRPPAGPGEDRSTNYYSVTPGYFKAMEIPLIRGRLFTEQDTKTSPRVALINETMARTQFPDEDPIGKGIHLSQGDDSFREIVGVVGDVKQYGLSQPTPLQSYEPYAQMPFGSMTLVVRTTSNPAALTGAIREQVLSIDKEQPISRSRTLDQMLAGSVEQQQFLMTLLGVFATLALVLAAVGLYGVMSYAVTQRTHEIGIRMALGANAGMVLRLVMRHGMTLALIGVVIGLAGSFAATRLMTSLLFGTSATDPLTFVGISVLLSGVALGACLVPAWRATRVDPMIALRHE
jgi:putative ABC transport system permease protein